MSGKTVSTYPVPVSRLMDWLPHRPPAVWIDEVLEAFPGGGKCGVTLKADAPYLTRDRIRTSSYLEWMAQAFGYTQAALILADPSADKNAKPERAYLAAIKNYVPERDPGPIGTIEGKMLTIAVRKTHQVGPIALIEGKVLDWDGKPLASAELKLFGA